MERPYRREWICDWLWFLAWGIASSLWCWTAARELGATFDEPVYIQRGMEVWRTGSHRGLLQLGTMPLPIDVCTFPLFLWERWHHLRLDAVHGLENLLPWARTATLAFWWLLLIYARLAGRHLAGAWGGRLAVAFIACEPVLLAHASLATTDIAITACLLALVYHFRTGREAGWFRRIALPGAWFAASLLAKASALVFGPLCLLAVELEWGLFNRSLMRARPSSPRSHKRAVKQPFCERGDDGDARRGERSNAPHDLTTSPPRRSALLRPFVRDFAQIFAVGLLLTFLYCGSDWRADPSFLEWAHHLPDGTSSRALVWVAEHLRIFSNAGEGLVRQVKHNVRGHGTYLLGRVADRAIWYYFPIALTIKLSIPVLILPVLLAVARPRVLASWACMAALALLLFSVTYRVQIGIRLVLPLIALVLVGLAAAAVRARSVERGAPCAPRSALRAPRFALPALLAASIVWNAATAWSVWPNGLCYTNEFWGGTRRGYLCLSDSNYDWGQGLKELACWQQRHRDGPLSVWYFGSDPALATLPLQEIRFDQLAIRRPEDVLAQVRGRYLAVSTTILYGSIACSLRSNPAGLASYQQARSVLASCRPADRTTTFLIYDFTGAP
jgi:hypothetical protein